MPGDLYRELQRYNAAHNADIIIIPKPDISYLSMKTLIEVHREGNYFVLKRAYFSNPDNNPGIFVLLLHGGLS